MNEIDPVTVDIWRFLLMPTALAWIEAVVPNAVTFGQRCTSMVPDNAPVGLLPYLQAEANMGTQGAKGVHDQITSIGVEHFGRLKVKMRHLLPLHGWSIVMGDYRDLPNKEVTWFVDPPYNNDAGLRYRYGPSSIGDYDELARWCRSRKGQVIVCENVGASWLPFRVLTDRRMGVKSRYQHSAIGEAFWHSEWPGSLGA